jgi:hypothetical protein
VYLLLETGDRLLLETGDGLLLEDGVPTPPTPAPAATVPFAGIDTAVGAATINEEFVGASTPPAPPRRTHRLTATLRARISFLVAAPTVISPAPVRAVFTLHARARVDDPRCRTRAQVELRHHIRPTARARVVARDDTAEVLLLSLLARNRDG